MSIYDDKTVEKNVAEHNEIYKSGVTPTHKDIRWTSAERRQRDKDMKQFCKSSGESGTDPYIVATDAYREGWERLFGKKKDPAIALLQEFFRLPPGYNPMKDKR